MKKYKFDIYRYYGKYRETIAQRLLRPDGLRYMIVFRKSNSCKLGVTRAYYRFILNRLKKKTFIQIPHRTNIGKGFYIGHNGRIIINEKTRIGDNCNVATGVVIGQENRGKRKGCPKIGNKVWIGANAVVVGNIEIGDNVLIAPLCYVNFDVPSNSIVVGNPGRIIPRQDATDGYVNRVV